MSIARLAAVIALLLAGGNYAADSFSTQPTYTQQHRCTSAASSSITHQRHHQCLQSIRHQKNHQSTTTALSVIGTGTASLLAGSLGGAIGVGVAYPLDTLKTKAQVYGQQSSQARKEQQLLQKQQQQQQIQEVNAMSNSTAATMIPLGPPGTVSTRDGTNYDIESPEDDLISLVKLILDVEGIAGFFGGVKAMMIGQALIKSVAFSANQLALGVLNDPSRLGGVEVLEQAATASSSSDEGASFVTLIMAASFAGFITSFLVAPVGKICFAYTCLSVGRSVNLFCQVSISQQCNPISLVGVNIIIWQSSMVSSDITCRYNHTNKRTSQSNDASTAKFTICK